MKWTYAGALLALVLGCSQGTAEQQLREIEAELGRDYPMSSVQREALTRHVEDGKAALARGDEQQAGRAFASARAILDRAAQAHVFNQAE